MKMNKWQWRQPEDPGCLYKLLIIILSIIYINEKKTNPSFSSTTSVLLRHPPPPENWEMGFLYYAIRLPKVVNLTFFLNILSQVRFLIIGALTRLGLYKPPPEEVTATDNSNNYILILDGLSPSLVPVPVHVVTAAIKKRVPIVKYRDFLERLDQDEDGNGEKVCTICLESVELRHEIRELCNCNHVFHRECLDTWIDEGQVSCPLCRSMLLPPRNRTNHLWISVCLQFSISKWFFLFLKFYNSCLASCARVPWMRPRIILMLVCVDTTESRENGV